MTKDKNIMISIITKHKTTQWIVLVNNAQTKQEKLKNKEIDLIWKKYKQINFY